MLHALYSVLDLKHAIQAKYKIAIQHQVLVVNGGECMVAERRVCSYSAGTVSNKQNHTHTQKQTEFLLFNICLEDNISYYI